MKRLASGLLAIALLGAALGVAPAAQGVSSPDAYYLRRMLQAAHETVKLHYYDPALHGLDWDARYRDYDEKLKSAGSFSAGQAIVAAFLDGLDDSHTFLQPPAPSYQLDYGYLMSLIGDDAFVTQVRPGSDAASKVRRGDRVVTISGYDIDRAGFHKMQYILNTLAPRSSTELVLRDAAGVERKVTVASVVHPRRITRVLTNGNEISAVQRQAEEDARWRRSRRVEMGDLMIWKMPVFFADDSEIDAVFSAARKHAALILDLRGNPGGRVDTLTRMIGNAFDHDVPVATRKARGGATSLSAATRGRNAYGGKLIVLIDQASASASEVFARVIQLEQRGIVIGDRSAGAVMEAMPYPFEIGNDTLLYYVLSVTDADLLMKDGLSLERTGVTPDEVLWPSPADLASGRDPVLSRAAHLAGLTLDPAAAGKLFPYEWRPFS